MTLDEKIARSKQRHSEPRPAETWVKPGWVTDLTGWRKEKLRMAREQGLIKYKEEGSRYVYLLESINPIFLKNQIQTQ